DGEEGRSGQDRGVAGAGPLPQPPLPHRGRPRDLRPRVRRPRGRARSARGGAPRARHPGLPDPARGRGTDGRLRRDPARRPHALPRQRPPNGGSARVGRPGQAPARRGRGAALRHGAQDRRPGGLVALRGRQVGKGCDARQRHGRRGRLGAATHDPLRPGPPRRRPARRSGAARRGVHRPRGLREAQRGARGRGQKDVRQPQEPGGGVHPAARPEGHGAEAAHDPALRRRRGRRDLREPLRDAGGPEGLRAARQPLRGARGHRVRRCRVRAVGEGTGVGGVPDRRGRREGGLAGAAARPRVGGEVAAVGHRLQVRAVGGPDEAAGHHHQRRKDGGADAAGGAGAGQRGRGDDLEGHAAQRGLRQGEGHPHRGHGRHRAGGGRDPAGRQGHRGRPERRRTGVRHAVALPGVRRAGLASARRSGHAVRQRQVPGAGAGAHHPLGLQVRDGHRRPRREARQAPLRPRPHKRRRGRVRTPSRTARAAGGLRGEERGEPRPRDREEQGAALLPRPLRPRCPPRRFRHGGARGLPFLRRGPDAKRDGRGAGRDQGRRRGRRPRDRRVFLSRRQPEPRRPPDGDRPELRAGGRPPRRRAARGQARGHHRHVGETPQLLRRATRRGGRHVHLVGQQEHRLRARRRGGRLEAGAGQGARRPRPGRGGFRGVALL
ncbi:MAG: DNA ligase (NAD(+)), partial [uncultured Rubrobacteraceae bacterium]